MGYGVVSVNAQGDQDICARIGDARLQKLDQLAGHVTGPPLDGDAPHNVGQHVEQTHAQVCECQLFNEEVHAGLPGAVQEKSDQHGRVAQDNDREQDPQKHKLFSLQEQRGKEECN